MNPPRRTPEPRTGRPGRTRSRAGSARGDQAGAATALAVGLAAALVLVGMAAAWVTATVARHRSAQAAADLAALAGAAARQQGSDPCAEVARIAAANRTRVAGCAVDGDEVWVTVSVEAPPLLTWTADLTGRARAGPDP